MPKFDEVYKKLNPSQKKAVDTIDGPVLIIAGPGTGKTTVLTMRIANILNNTDVSPQNILALTFTESGVKAMKEKLIDLIGDEAYYVNIYTFHSFASDIISEFGERFASGIDLEPLNDLERVQIFKEIIDTLDLEVLRPFNSPYYYLGTLIKSIGDLKREGVDAQELKLLIKDEEYILEQMDRINPKTKKPYGKYIAQETNVKKQKELVLIYEAYQRKIKSRGRYDFEDMIMFVLNRMKIDEEFRLVIQERYQYILVDEYQDTNTAQNELVLELASYWGEDANIFVVGDDDQAIYRFQGASIENILMFNNNFPNAEIIVLDRNYRSDQNLIDASSQIISTNKTNINQYIDIDKHFYAASDSPGEKVQIASFKQGIVENYYIMKEIEELTKKGSEYSQIAVLVRDNKDTEDIEKMFSRSNIPYYTSAGNDVLQEGSIIRLLNLFKLIKDIQGLNDENPILHFIVLNYEFIDVDKLDVLKLANIANRNRASMFEIVIKLIEEMEPENSNQISLIDMKVVQKREYDTKGFEQLEFPEKIIKFYKDLFNWQFYNDNSTFLSFFEKVVNESGYINWLLSSEYKIENLNLVNTLFSEAKKLNSSDKTLELRKFMDNLELMKENKIKIESRDFEVSKSKVNIMTAHRAKGLEFDYVFIKGVVDKKWGGRSSKQNIRLPEGIIKNIDISKIDKDEDERRLFYVALTRAKKKAYVSYSDKYADSQGEKSAIASMFVRELKGKSVEVYDADSFQEEFKDEITRFNISEAGQKALDGLDEKDYIDRLLGRFKLSPTALNSYIDCAYKFKLNNLYRMPRAKSVTLSFGSAVHKALEEFFRKYKVTEKLPKVDLLLEEFEKALRIEVLTADEFSKTLRKGNKVLKNYYEMYSGKFEIPLHLEFPFGWGMHKAYLEDIPLSGKIDKIEIIDPIKKTFRVVDYKTGKARSRNEIMGKTKAGDESYYRQILFYKLLVSLDPNLNLDITEAEFDFIEGLTKHQFTYSDENLVDFKGLVKTNMKKIRNHEFDRTQDRKKCERCEFKDHCWPDGF